VCHFDNLEQYLSSTVHVTPAEVIHTNQLDLWKSYIHRNCFCWLSYL